MITQDPREVLSILEKDTEIAIDTETTGLSPWRDKIALVQLYGNISKTPVLFRCDPRKDQSSIAELSEDLFTSNRLFIGHNLAAFDLLMLHNSGFADWENSHFYDTLVGECIISTTGRQDVSKSLKASVRRRLGFAVDKDIEHGQWMADELSDDQITYAEQDVMHLHKLRDVQMKIAAEKEMLDELNLEMNILRPVAKMVLNGLPIDLEKYYAYYEQQQEIRDKFQEQLESTIGPINFNSPQQLKKAIEQRYGVRMKSTNKAALAERAYFDSGPLADFCKLLLDFKVPQQFLKTYNPEWIETYVDDARVHARFWQAGTDTLRFSSSNPNMQQVPRTARGLFGGLPGHQIIAVDYSQLEVRIAAALADDRVMLEALESDDVHSAVGSQIYMKFQSEVTKEERRNAKAATFTLLFGGTADALFAHARQQGDPLSYSEASRIVERFFETYAGLKTARARAYAVAQNHRVVTVRLPLGAKRVLVGRTLKPSTILNTTVQGTAAIGLKVAILDMYEKTDLFDYIGVTVHDEMVGAFPDPYVCEAQELMQHHMIEGMKRVLPPNVKIKTEAKVGEYWKS